MLQILIRGVRTQNRWLYDADFVVRESNRASDSSHEEKVYGRVREVETVEWGNLNTVHIQRAESELHCHTTLYEKDRQPSFRLVGGVS